MVIISIIGSQGSGKSTTGELVAKALNCLHVEASKIVAEEMLVTDRSIMAKTNARTEYQPNWLGDAIMAYAMENITPNSGYRIDMFVLTGAREPEVHKSLREAWQSYVYSFAVIADPITRWRRQKGRKADTPFEFSLHEKNEVMIGLPRLMESEPIVATFDTTKEPPETIAEQIVERVKKSEDFRR